MKRSAAAVARPRRKSSSAKPRQASLDDATLTVAASVPRSVVTAVKAQVGARGFSRFVTAALERELRHIARTELVADVVAHSGPLDPAKVKALQRLIRG